MSPKKGKKMTGGTVGKRTMLDPSVLNTNFQNAPQPAGTTGMTFGPAKFTGLPQGLKSNAMSRAIQSRTAQRASLRQSRLARRERRKQRNTGKGISSSQGPRLFNPNAMSGISYGSSQGPGVMLNKQKAMPLPPGGIMGSTGKGINTITTPQGPKLFNPNSPVNKGGAMSGGAMTSNAITTPQGPKLFNPNTMMDRTIGRGAGAFGIQGRSLVRPKGLTAAGRAYVKGRSL